MKMYCIKCGSSLENGAKFCPHCGQVMPIQLNPTPVQQPQKFDPSALNQPDNQNSGQVSEPQVNQPVQTITDQQGIFVNPPVSNQPQPNQPYTNESTQPYVQPDNQFSGQSYIPVQNKPFDAQLYQQNYNPYVDQNEEVECEEKIRLMNKVFKWGLLGLIFSETVILSILGIIFSAKAKKMANLCKNMYGSLKGKGRIGHIFSIIGLVSGIFVTALLAYVVFVVVLTLLIETPDVEKTYSLMNDVLNWYL